MLVVLFFRQFFWQLYAKLVAERWVMDYIINKNTCFLMFDGKNTVINELATELVIQGNTLKNILESSCEYYGSSLKGRIIGARNIIKSRYRIPIIVSEKNNILLFPLNGKKNEEHIWFNFGMIKSYEKAGEFVNITFNNGFSKKFMISYAILNNQILKCSRLLVIYMSRV